MSIYKGKDIYVDIDNTVCSTVGMNYKDAVPIKENIAKVNKMFDQGATITYWTARGTKTGIDWYAVTKAQLDEWGAKHDKLLMGKPAFDILIDDKVLNSIHHWSNENVDSIILQ